MTINHYLPSKLLILTLLILTSTVASAALVRVDFSLSGYTGPDYLLGIGGNTTFPLKGSFTYDTSVTGTASQYGFTYSNAVMNFQVQLGDNLLAIDTGTLTITQNMTNSTLDSFSITTPNNGWSGDFIAGPLTGTQIGQTGAITPNSFNMLFMDSLSPKTPAGQELIVLPENNFDYISLVMSTSAFSIGTNPTPPTTETYTVSTVPLPGSVILLFSGLVSMLGLNSRRRCLVKA